MNERPIYPDDPVTFTEAAKILLRGLVTASTLEAAAKRGELETERLGRRIVTTPAMIEQWRNLSRRPATSKPLTTADDIAARDQLLAILKEGAAPDKRKRTR